ncbi:hypothetical protein DM02DRAFT_668342 [Periconia macrospinosa]|uniref:BTB domain-containing protein n=1 Tax=Periconia macrospinosa TaxID=97972 RepID=A0A2V1E7W4_9PLEO|nr:hypothetical protein DM02DRAFT_668342 [Periconia macrospinosa]
MGNIPTTIGTSRELLLSDIKDLLTSGEYSDLTITCGDDTYKVHKAIVCKRSEFFKRAVSFGGKETEDNLIELKEDEPEVIELLLEYLYSGDYNTPDSKNDEAVLTPSKPAENEYGQIYSYEFPHTCQGHGSGIVCPHHECERPHLRRPGYANYVNEFECEDCMMTCINYGTDAALLTHSKMYEMADKYSISGLKYFVMLKFQACCKAFWNSPMFPLTAHHAFISTPENDKGLRDIITNTISMHMELLKKPEVEALMLEFNGLAFSLLKEKCVEKEPENSVGQSSSQSKKKGKSYF